MSDAPLPSSFDGDSDFYDENRWQKFTRRLKEEPLIPFGVGVTCWALLNAARSIRTGNGAQTNRFFRYRLYAQSFTLVAMIGGSLYYNADRLKRKEYVKLKDQQKAQQKKDAWIRELEARDAEDQEWRAKMGKVRDLQREEAERKAVEEKKRKDAGTDDGRGAIAAIKEKMRGVAEDEARREKVETKPVKTKPMEAKAPVPKTPLPVAATPPPSELRRERPDSILGESKEGGLLGINHIKNWWNSGKKKEAADDGERPKK